MVQKIRDLFVRLLDILDDKVVVFFERGLIALVSYIKKRVIFFSFLGVCLVVLLLWILPAIQVKVHRKNHPLTLATNEETRIEHDREMFKLGVCPTRLTVFSVNLLQINNLHEIA
jgi:hypothetical protein